MEKYFENIIFCQLKAEIVDGKREEIEDGDFRPTYLRESPFNFPKPAIKILDKDIEHSKNPNLKCYLYLYSKNQLKQLIEN